MASAVIAGAPAWRRSSPDTVDDDLAALWRELAREGPLSPALLSNLVIFDPARQARPSRARLAEIARRHPARVVLLDYTVGPAAPCAPDALSVGVLTFGPSASRYGVELIAVHSACAEASVSSVVRRLIRGDVPTTLWSVGDLSRVPPSTAMTRLGRQLVYDSGAWSDVGAGVRAIAGVLDDTPSIVIADLGWRRLAPLRRALAQGTEGLAIEPTAVRVTHQPGRAAIGWLLAGWLMNRLGSALSGGGPRVTEAQAAGDALVSVALEAGDWTVHAALTVQAATVSRSGWEAPLSVAVPGETEAEAVAAELHALGESRLLRDAVRALAQAFGDSPSGPARSQSPRRAK